MTTQAMAEQIAKLALPRLLNLLKLKVRHVYETTPGQAKSKLVVAGVPVEFKLLTSTQPYVDIERFVADDKVMGFIVNPGLLPIAKALSQELRGRKMLVTRRIQPGDAAAADFDLFGMRVAISYDEALRESRVVWECLYAVA